MQNPMEAAFNDGPKTTILIDTSYAVKCDLIFFCWNKLVFDIRLQKEHTSTRHRSHARPVGRC